MPLSSSSSNKQFPLIMMETWTGNMKIVLNAKKVLRLDLVLKGTIFYLTSRERHSNPLSTKRPCIERAVGIPHCEGSSKLRHESMWSLASQIGEVVGMFSSKTRQFPLNISHTWSMLIQSIATFLSAVTSLNKNRNTFDTCVHQNNPSELKLCKNKYAQLCNYVFTFHMIPSSRAAELWFPLLWSPKPVTDVRFAKI